jgi:group I intron endonuclease
MGYIYKITNTITNKCYIGETKQPDPETRWKKHKNTIKKGVGCPALQDAVKKYGIEFFKFEILIICFDEDRYKYEIEYIKKYNSKVPNGYNILDGGPGGSFKGKKHTEETKKRISENLKGMKNPNYGKKKTKEQLQKMSEVMKNVNLCKKISNETLEKRRLKLINNPEIKEKISNSLKKYHKNKIIKKNIHQYDLDNVLINSFKSIIDAANVTQICRHSIGRVCCNKQKLAGGFIWKRESI